jgi:hypothetical protein
MRGEETKRQAMHNNPVEATVIAVVLLVLWLIGAPLPAKFSLRGVLSVTTLIAVVLGVIALAARH